MSRTKRVLVVSLQVLAAGFAFEAVGCSDSNEPSTTAGAGATGGTGGSSAGTGGSGGTGGGTGGSTGGAGGSTGGSTTGSGGAGTGGAAGGGTGGAGGGGNDFSPLCSAVPPTTAGEPPTKGGACTPSDTQLCYKTCGPLSIGFKSETCTGGVYVEQSGCSFPAGQNYACYKIPTAVSPTCPTAVPQASQACTVAECTLCNVGGMYLDSSGASKEGYCVCPAAGTSGSRKWSCASSTAWPCPAGQGC
jgi:hypothetical protein